MTLPAELRQEADRTIQVSHDGGGMYVYRYYHDEPTRALLHRAADALEECEKAERVAKLIHRKKGLRIDVCD